MISVFLFIGMVVYALGALSAGTVIPAKWNEKLRDQSAAAWFLLSIVGWIGMLSYRPFSWW